jgi:hypothetical protein
LIRESQAEPVPSVLTLMGPFREVAIAQAFGCTATDLAPARHQSRTLARKGKLAMQEIPAVETHGAGSSMPATTPPPSESALQGMRLPHPSPLPAKANWDISQLRLAQDCAADNGESIQVTIPVAGVCGVINQRLSDTELDSLYKVVCEGINRLQRLSEIGTGGRARILYRELAGELEQRGTLDELKVLATYIEEQPGKRLQFLRPGEDGVDVAVARLKRRAEHKQTRNAELDQIRYLDKTYRSLEPTPDELYCEPEPWGEPNLVHEYRCAERELISALEVYLLTLPGEMTCVTGQELLMKAKTTAELISLLVGEEEMMEQMFAPSWWSTP